MLEAIDEITAEIERRTSVIVVHAMSLLVYDTEPPRSGQSPTSDCLLPLQRMALWVTCNHLMR